MSHRSPDQPAMNLGATRSFPFGVFAIPVGRNSAALLWNFTDSDKTVIGIKRGTTSPPQFQTLRGRDTSLRSSVTRWSRDLIFHHIASGIMLLSLQRGSPWSGKGYDHNLRPSNLEIPSILNICPDNTSDRTSGSSLWISHSLAIIPVSWYSLPRCALRCSERRHLRVAVLVHAIRSMDPS
jgi:hypothetical protein